MKSIQFFAPGIPKGQPRPRATFNPGTKHARVYDPATAEGWKGMIALAAQKHRPNQPLASALQLTLYFFMPRPKGHYVAGILSRGLKAAAPARPVGKPDCDNLAKAAMDVLTNLGFWTDDSLITNLDVHKLYADGREQPGMTCVISEYNPCAGAPAEANCAQEGRSAPRDGRKAKHSGAALDDPATWQTLH